ncbi:S-layer homology domain-containing protein [Bacillus smithii]|uniref:S-layer homology domain-containing protein n=1 Tax=Bacillus smithii TaxID=1479 RepID=UPI002E1AFF7C|nr:S-layer homology domain-containing protein [Bacillus smithii]MED4926584.1 S-layer homology domain-containing protein [Bacillus smithii]
MKKKNFAGALAFAALLAGAIPAFAADSDFRDVPKSSYAYSAIVELAERGVVSGYSDGTFHPNETVTRGQFAGMIARAFNLPKGSSHFKDVPKSKSLYEEISKAADAGIIKGTGGNFYPDRPVTRADMAVMLDRAMNLKGNFKEEGNLKFKDNVPAYALESVKRMVFYGVIQGKTNGTFAPGEYADRASSSVLVSRALQIIERNETKPSDPTEPSDPTSPSTPPNPSNTVPDYVNMSLAQLHAKYGDWTLVRRIDGMVPGGGIETDDLLKTYYNELHQSKDAYKSLPDPETYVENESRSLRSQSTLVSAHYPDYEIISFNGKAWKDSEIYMDGDVDKVTATVLPTQPKEANQYLIDLHIPYTQFGVYGHDKVTVGQVQPTYTKSGVVMVDVKGLFAQVPTVTVANDGKTVQYNGTTIKLTLGSNQIQVNGESKTLSVNVEAKNGTVYAPGRELAKELGWYTRSIPIFKRLEFSSYPLPQYEGLTE